MSRVFYGAAILTLGLGAGGCALMPELPPDWSLPMQEILLHTACEMQMALRDIDYRVNPEYFNARGWKITVNLFPKADADIQPGAGLTRRVPNLLSAVRFSSWVVGASPGVTLEMRGERSGSTDFTFDSEKLIQDKHLPCDRESVSYHSLTKYFGIREWLYRSVDASALAGSAIDAPKFTADVYIKFNGSNSYTYTFPPGTDYLTLGGYYTLDEQLNITFTTKPKVVDKFSAVTLPRGGDDFAPNRAPIVYSAVTILEDQQLSLQQIRQQLQNLRPAIQ
jgi:hypothetical protein